MDSTPMRVDLERIAIDAPSHPTEIWNLNERDWERYEVHAYIDGVHIARLNITRALNIARRHSDAFFFDLYSNPAVPKPFVSYQETDEQLRGQGISGKLIILANEFYKGKLGTNVHSDTISIPPSKRVWEKLQELGFANYVPYQPEPIITLDRWVVI